MFLLINYHFIVKKLALSVVICFNLTILYAQKNFSFIFLPDLHLSPDTEVLANFNSVSKQVNRLKPDFVITGGDMIYTAKSVDDKKASVLFYLMDEQLEKFRMPVYLTMGNHETVGITAESGIDSSNPMWGKRMFEERYNKRYYSFNYEGWKFFVLDGIRIREKEKDYTSGIDEEQIKWIENELLSTGKETPIVIIIHTPLLNPHAMTDSGSDVLSLNSEKVLGLFENNNLKIVLQGHNHIYMNLYINGKHYISGGSTAYGTDPGNNGFVMVKVRKGFEKTSFISLIKV